MESLLTLIEKWHAVAAHAEDNPNDFDANKAANEARYALDLRMTQLTGFLEGLYEAGAPGAVVVLNKIDPERWPNREQRMAILRSEFQSSDPQ